MPLASSDADTVINFLRDKLEPDDLEQVAEILKRYTDGAAMDEPPPFPGRPRPGGTIDPGAMDSKSRRNFEKQHGIAPRRIRVLG